VLFTLPDDGVRRLRAVLDEAGFSEQGLKDAVGDDLTGFARRMPPMLLRRTAEPTRLNALIRLFRGVLPVPVDEASAALDPVPIADLVDAQVLDAVDADRVRSNVQLCHHEDLIVAVDPDWILTHRPVGADHVMGLSRSTLFLARLTDRVPAESALDLGTGCGVQALILTRHSARVVATDITDRAVAMARFNAGLNGLDIDVRQGDLFDPVEGEAFDLIVSNPPFVVAPPLAQHFLSAGFEADDLMVRLARETPARLRPGGRAHFLGNWAIPSDRPWEERTGAWFEGSGCDVSVVWFDRYPIDEYAARWIPPHIDDPEVYSSMFDEWMRWYEDRRIAGIVFGLVTMRRREGPGESVRMTTPPLNFRTMDGVDLQVALALGRWLEGADDDAFLSSRLHAHDRVRAMREYALRDGGWVQTGGMIGVDHGFADPALIDEHGERLVAACDGTRPVGQLVSEMAQALGLPFEEVAPRVVPALRDLVERGILIPGDEQA
jgi:methylase of polypeptide subunit release factors